MTPTPFTYPIELKRFRILFTDGNTFDVITPADNSNVRAWALGIADAEWGKDKTRGIAGMAHVKEESGGTQQHAP